MTVTTGTATALTTATVTIATVADVIGTADVVSREALLRVQRSMASRAPTMTPSRRTELRLSRSCFLANHCRSTAQAVMSLLLVQRPQQRLSLPHPLRQALRFPLGGTVAPCFLASRSHAIVAASRQPHLSLFL